jgi:hypothetical protein
MKTGVLMDIPAGCYLAAQQGCPLLPQVSPSVLRYVDRTNRHQDVNNGDGVLIGDLPAASKDAPLLL